MEEIDAWERASELLRYPARELLALGYADIAARRLERALQAFDRAVASLPPGPAIAGNSFFANLTSPIGEVKKT